MNGEPIDDAELDAFLKGEDALSQALQAMAPTQGQSMPSAELDAAIMARAEALMAAERARSDTANAAPEDRPAAANDAIVSSAPARPLPHLGLRWRVPAGIAAVLVAGVLAHQSWEADAGRDDAARPPVLAPIPVPVPVPLIIPSPDDGVDSGATPPPPPPAVQGAKEPAPRAQADKPQPTAPTPLAKAAGRPQPPSAMMPAPRQAAAAAAEYPAPPPPPPEPLAREAARAPAAAAPAPADSADSAIAQPQERGTVQVSGRRSRVDVQPRATPKVAGAADPAAWLAAIDELLRAGLQRDSVEEWDKFRAAYPDYPVPKATVDKIEALRR